MATTKNTVKVSASISRKLSVAVGLLCFAAFIVQGLGRTWGFEAISEQITQTALLFAGGINIYFLGSTAQKEISEKQDGTNN